MAEENKFDSLTIKCLEEIPFLVEVLTSTCERVREVFKPLNESMLNTVTQKMKEKKNWKIRDTSWVFLPMTYYDYVHKEKVSKLDTHFSFQWIMKIEKRQGAQIKSFSIVMGYWYDSFHNPKPIFLFEIESNSSKFVFNNLSFYQKIQNDNPFYKYKIEHPEQNDDNERLGIINEEINTNKLNEVFNFFLNAAVIPFVENLK